VILGSGTGIPSSRRASPAALLISDTALVLIDSGSGTLRRLLDVGSTHLDLDVLLYTHIHPDHVSDLVPILFATKYSDLPRQKDLLCIGGPGFRDYFDQLRAIYEPWIDPKSYRFIIEEISEGPLLCKDLKIFGKTMAHNPESVGYRIEMKDGKTIAISGDTDYCKNLVELAAGVDLLMVECSFPNGKKMDGHLTPSLAGRIAVESNCKKLLLSHLYPVCDQFDIVEQCRGAYKGEIILSEDLMRVKI
jgi:ribonuclease BN (tRNA processing enzyme)